jgi:hypothetical protein
VRIAALLLLVLTACGDGKPKVDKPDSGGAEPMADAMVDAPMGQLTFTAYVIDMVTTGTSNLAQPRPYAEFATLPDLDLANPAAYQMLF